MNQITKTFNGVSLALLESAEGLCLSDEQVGIALGYADPAKGIQKVVDRDQHGELSGLSTFVKVTKVEGDREVTRDVRVWGKEGVIAITFLAKTKIAAQLRVWARQELCAPTAKPVSEVDRLAAMTNQIAGMLTGAVVEAKQIAGEALRVASSAVELSKEAAIAAADEHAATKNIKRKQIANEVGEIGDLMAKRGHMNGNTRNCCRWVARQIQKFGTRDGMTAGQQDGALMTLRNIRKDVEGGMPPLRLL